MAVNQNHGIFGGPTFHGPRPPVIPSEGDFQLDGSRPVINRNINISLVLQFVTVLDHLVGSVT